MWSSSAWGIVWQCVKKEKRRKMTGCTWARWLYHWNFLNLAIAASFSHPDVPDLATFDPINSPLSLSLSFYHRAPPSPRVCWRCTTAMARSNSTRSRVLLHRGKRALALATHLSFFAFRLEPPVCYASHSADSTRAVSIKLWNVYARQTNKKTLALPSSIYRQLINRAHSIYFVSFIGIIASRD